MFRTEHARRERCDVRVLAELHKPRCSHALLVDNWRAARRQRFFRDSKEVACSSLDIGSSLGYVLPSELGKDNSMLGFTSCYFRQSSPLGLGNALDMLRPFRLVTSKHRRRRASCLSMTLPRDREHDNNSCLNHQRSDSSAGVISRSRPGPHGIPSLAHDDRHPKWRDRAMALFSPN